MGVGAYLPLSSIAPSLGALLGHLILLLHPQLQIARQGFGIHASFPAAYAHAYVPGLGTYRALGKENTSLPSAYTVLAEGNRVAKPEGHQAETELGVQGGVWGQEALN